MFGKTNIMTTEARFGTSAAFNGLPQLATVQNAANAKRRERLVTAAIAAVVFVAAFAAVLIMGV